MQIEVFKVSVVSSKINFYSVSFVTEEIKIENCLHTNFFNVFSVFIYLRNKASRGEAMQISYTVISLG